MERNELTRRVLECYETERFPPLVTYLPSYGVVYPASTFFARTGAVVYRKLDGKSEEWSTDAFLAGSRYLLNFLFEKQILFNTGSDKMSLEDFLVADRDAILLNQRIVSYGNKLAGVRLHCSHCDAKLEQDTIEIENYETERLNLNELNQLEENQNLFFYRSPDGKWKIRFRFLTVKDEQELSDAADKDIYSDGQYGIIPYLLKIIQSINGIENKEAIYEMMANDDFPIIENRRFQNYVRRNTPYVKIHTKETKCKECGEGNSVRADVDLSLIEINNQGIRTLMTEEIFFLHKQLRIPFDDLYAMPLDIRKRLFDRTIEFLKQQQKEHDEKIANQPKPMG